MSAAREGFIISSAEATVRKEADVKEHDEGIAPAIAEERSLTDRLCSRPFPDEIVKIAQIGQRQGNSCEGRACKIALLSNSTSYC